MKKVKFLKNHINGIKKGQVGEFSEGRAEYLVRSKVAEYVTEQAPKEAKPEPKKAVKQTKGDVKQAVKKDEPCKTC